MLSPWSTRRDGRTGPPAGTLLGPLLLCLVLVATGCTDDAGESTGTEPAPSAETPSATTPEPPRVRTRVEVGRVTGRLPRRESRAISRRVASVVDGWWRAAYLGGEYPRQGFGKRSWPGFSRDAVRQARADRGLMSNARIGTLVDTVTAKRRRVVVDLLATDRTPRAATARTLLVFRTEGDRESTFTVSGRLFLTREERGWKVFGYDVSKARGAPDAKRTNRTKQTKKKTGKKGGRR